MDDRLTIHLPAQVIGTAGELVVTGPKMAAAPAAREALTAVEIQLLVDGEEVQPEQPIEIVFTVPEAALRPEIAAEDQLSAGWYDEAAQVWVEEPVEVATAADGAAVVTLRLDHLTSVAQWILNNGWIVTSSTHYRLYLEELALSTTQSEIKKILDSSWDAYVTAGYTAPTRKIPVYIYKLVGSPAYQPMCGYIELDAAFDAVEVAHDVFHAFQNAQWTMFSMSARRWWVEAMAEYSANTLATTSTQWTEKLQPDFFSKPLSTVDESHEYALAGMAVYLAASGGSPKEAQSSMFDSLVLTGHGEDLFAAAVESQLPVKFERFYQDFAVWTLRASDGPPKELQLSSATSVNKTLTTDLDELVVDLTSEPWALGILGLTVAPSEAARPLSVRVTGCPASVWVVNASQRGGSVNHPLFGQAGDLTTTVPSLGAEQRLLVLVGGREACASKVTVAVDEQSAWSGWIECQNAVDSGGALPDYHFKCLQWTAAPFPAADSWSVIDADTRQQADTLCEDAGYNWGAKWGYDSRQFPDPHATCLQQCEEHAASKTGYVCEG